MRILVKQPNFTYAPDEEQGVGTIQGIQAGSTEEWRVAQALGKFDIRFIYQYEIYDASVRGGIVLDFLVLTVPISTPLEVYGEYWHRGDLSSKDRMRGVIIDDYFRGQALPLLVFYGADLQDQEMADAKVRSEIFA
jgi:hypothetical protein